MSDPNKGKIYIFPGLADLGYFLSLEMITHSLFSVLCVQVYFESPRCVKKIRKISHYTTIQAGLVSADISTLFNKGSVIFLFSPSHIVRIRDLYVLHEARVHLFPLHILLRERKHAATAARWLLLQTTEWQTAWKLASRVISVACLCYICT